MPKPKTAQPQAPRLIVTTVRITAEQWQALRQAALERAVERGGGKADASELLREIIDEWMGRQ